VQRGWLTSKGLIESDYEKNHDHLAEKMKKYYFDPSDKVYNAWSDSELKSWLADHNVIKPEAQVKREKLIKIMSCVLPPPTYADPVSSIHSDNYSGARDTVWNSWSDSEIRTWLINNGYLKSDAQANRDELVKLINDK
jgi:hypothetical protein